jgi:hypothetical protein
MPGAPGNPIAGRSKYKHNEGACQARHHETMTIKYLFNQYLVGAEKSRVKGLNRLLPKPYPFERPLKAFCLINQGVAKDQ